MGGTDPGVGRYKRTLKIFKETSVRAGSLRTLTPKPSFLIHH